MRTIMTGGLIGVIVPVYKVEKYIAECIESILAQTYTKFRLILVDDGTPDNAGKICDEYAKKDSRITVIHQENAGVTRARARGVEEASDCEWISFVDGDDKIPPRALEELFLASTKNEKIDIILGFRTEVLNGEGRYVYNKIGNGLYSPIDYINAMLVDNCAIGPWAKIIRRKLFTKEALCIPRKVVQYEDLYMNIITSWNARYIYIDNDINAYQHLEDSQSSQYLYNKYMKEDGWYVLLSTIKTFFIRNGILEKVSENFSYFSYTRIAGCMNLNNKRFTKCSKLKLKVYTKAQRNIKRANANIIFYYFYKLIRIIKSYIK